MKVACLVPRRCDGGRRDEVWAWVRARWEREHPYIPIIEGHHVEGLFNRSKAINAAASQSSDADVYVISDSDTFVGAAQIAKAVGGSLDPDQPDFWLAYDVFSYLGKPMSEQIMAGYTGMWELGIDWTMAGTCSSMLVVTRHLFDTVGGFDESFEGWGFEDVAASHAFQTFGGGLGRVPGPAWHLWHPSSIDNNHLSPVWNANRERMLRYRDAAYDESAMRNLIEAA